MSSNYMIGKLRPFDEAMIFLMVNDPGVYVLYREGKVIYIGQTETIKDRLNDHFRGYDGPCTKQATSYCVEVTSDHKARQDELLNDFKAEYGRLPLCNDLI